MPSVLLVDDEPESRDVIGIMLDHIGFDVVVATSGQDALRLAEKGPDLILLDLYLPSLDGFDDRSNGAASDAQSPPDDFAVRAPDRVALFSRNVRKSQGPMGCPRERESSWSG